MFGGDEEQKFDSRETGATSNTLGNDDESASLLGKSIAKGEELLDQIESEPNYKLAGVFLTLSVLFFFATMTMLPLMLISPGSFNIYFCLGSVSLQLALAFFFSPMKYLKRLFSGANWFPSLFYISALVADLFFIVTGTDYFWNMILIAIQSLALAWFVIEALRDTNLFSRSGK